MDDSKPAAGYSYPDIYPIPMELTSAGRFSYWSGTLEPSELGRNTSYVFALPARYNYAFPTGYNEVEEILQNKPLHPF